MRLNSRGWCGIPLTGKNQIVKKTWKVLWLHVGTVYYCQKHPSRGFGHEKWHAFFYFCEIIPESHTCVLVSGAHIILSPEHLCDFSLPLTVHVYTALRQNKLITSSGAAVGWFTAWKINHIWSQISVTPHEAHPNNYREIFLSSERNIEKKTLHEISAEPFKNHAIHLISIADGTCFCRIRVFWSV